MVSVLTLKSSTPAEVRFIQLPTEANPEKLDAFRSMVMVLPFWVTPAVSVLVCPLFVGTVGIGSSEEEQAWISDTPKKANATVGQVVFRNSLLFFMVFSFKDSYRARLKKEQMLIFFVKCRTLLDFFSCYCVLIFIKIGSIAQFFSF